MGIFCINTNLELATEFVDFVYRLYCSDPAWIPPFRKKQLANLASSETLYDRKAGDSRHLLARTNGTTLGRISAFVNGSLQDGDGEQVGTIGNFECVEDFAAAEDLFNRALEWLEAKHGVNRIWAPINFDIWHGYRWMTQGFNQPRPQSEPYNKSYYPDFAERYGFTVKKRWESIDIKGQEDIDRLSLPHEECYQRFIRLGYRFKPVTKASFKEEIRRIHEVLADSFSDFLGYTPITVERFQRLHAGLRYALHDQLFCLVYDADDQLAGLSGAFLDPSEAVRRMGGRDHLLSKVRFLQQLRRSKHVLFYLTGATRETIAKRVGFGRSALFHFAQTMRAAGLDSFTIGPMLSDGVSRGLALGDAFPAHREYALYEIQR